NPRDRSSGRTGRRGSNPAAAPARSPAAPTWKWRTPSGSALHRVDFGDVDRAPVAEQRDEDRQANGSLGRGDGQDEEHEHLAGRVAELPRERHEVDVDREQQQLQAHQQDDDVLAVDEDAGNADAEQRGAEREEMARGQGEQGHGFTSTSDADPSSERGGCGGGGRTASTLTMRRRSPARTRAWSPGFWCLAPSRRRRVSITAAMTATVRITAAVSNGSRKRVNSASASHFVLEMPAVGSSASGVPNWTLTPISTSISTSITTATSRPTGR